MFFFEFDECNEWDIKHETDIVKFFGLNAC